MAASALLLTLLRASPAVGAGGRYTVVSGDSLWSIAQAHGCRVIDLRQANELSEGPLLVGTRLVIPRCSGSSRSKAATAAGREHRVASGDTLSAIATRYHTTVAELRALNELSDDVIVPGQRLRVGAPAPELPVRLVAGQSKGRPQHGSLSDGAKLPHSPQYYRRRPEWVYGAQHVIDHTRRAIDEVNRKHPSVHRLAIGDISAPKGGVLPGHGSHQSGRDIDLGLYFHAVPAGYPQEFVKAGDGKLDADATWTLIDALYRASKTAGGPEKIFLDYDVQGKVYEAARKAGVSRSTLAKIFQYPTGRWTRDRLVKHEPKHDDHLHVRFACPPRDDGCR
ncbi:MAG: penicillin-insensitive murein endopeptidase [Myxococcales bacterium]|nr:penicillin-insensitive murein endopeptidase [Myxococcales bacterium]